MKKGKLFWFIAGAVAVVGALAAVGIYLKKKAAALEEMDDDFSFEDCDCCCDEDCDCDESACDCEDECCDCGSEQDTCSAEDGCQNEVQE